MRGALFTALAAFFAVAVLAGPKPASALPAKAALDYSHTNGDLVEVKKKYKKRYRYGRSYYRPYRYSRPYYRPYGYYRPYYRPYPYYYRPYYRRPGVSLWFGF